MKAFTIEEYQQFYLNDDRLEKCYLEKWFKIFVPKTYNGLQLPMDKACRELVNIAKLQGGLGWTVNLGAGANWFSGFFEDEVARNLFSTEGAVIAGSGFTNGNWIETEGAYEISGEWSKCTGANHASLFSLSANNEQKGPKTFVVPREAVKLSDEKWPIMGMRNSSSFGITLERVSVPKDYDFQMNEIKNHFDYGVFHIPFQSFARLCMTASYLGVVHCLAQHCLEKLRKPEVISIIKDKLEPLLFASEKSLYITAKHVEKLSFAGEYSNFEEQKIRKDLGNKNLEIFNLVQELFLSGGLPFIEEDNMIHWAYRDVLTAVQHFMVKP